MSTGYPNPYGNPGTVSMAAGGETPLNQPLYGASFSQAVKRFFKKYATFSGRASRSEFWWVQLFNGIIIFALYAIAIGMLVSSIDPITGEPGTGFLLPMGIISIYGLAVLIPSIAVSMRRLHDANFSGWFYWLTLTGIGGIAVLIMELLPSAPEGARFDADGGAAAHGNAFGAPAGYPGAPAAGGFAGQNPPQGYQQPTDPTQG